MRINNILKRISIYLFQCGLFWIIFPIWYLGLSLDRFCRYDTMKEAWKDYWIFFVEDIQDT